MKAAAIPVPAEAKAALRPNRSLIPLSPATPRLIETNARPSMLLAAAWTTREASTTGKIGHAAKARALAPIATSAKAATTRTERAESTSAPNGIWPTRLTRPLTVRTRPMSTCVHFWVVRNTATNGPKPVWISATKKTNQSRLRRLRAETGRRRSSFELRCNENPPSSPASAIDGAVPGCMRPHRQGLGAEEFVCGGGVAGASEDEPGGPAGEAGGAAGEAGGAAGEGGGAFARPNWFALLEDW